MTLLRTLVVTAALAVATALASTATAVAEDCSDGVVVVIDATALGGSVSTTCVNGAPGTGLDALAAAGHRVGFVPGQFGFICTINERPDPCNRAPSNAYWSYWTAEQGGSWSYSNAGAAARSPKPGTVDGWRFGDGSRAPGIAPPGGTPVAEPDPPSDAEQPPSSGTTPGGSSDSSGSGSSGSGSSGSDSAGSGSSGSGGSSSGSSGSGSSGSSGSGSSGSGSGSTGDSGGADTDDRQVTSDGGNAQRDAGSDSDPASGESAAGATEDAAETDADAPDQPIEPAELPEEPLSLELPEEQVAEAEEGGRDDATPAPRDSGDDLALAESDSDGAPTGLIAGGGLLAGLAGLTAFQVRRRRLEA